MGIYSLTLLKIGGYSFSETKSLDDALRDLSISTSYLHFPQFLLNKVFLTWLQVVHH